MYLPEETLSGGGGWVNGRGFGRTPSKPLPPHTPRRGVLNYHLTRAVMQSSLPNQQTEGSDERQQTERRFARNQQKFQEFGAQPDTMTDDHQGIRDAMGQLKGWVSPPPPYHPQPLWHTPTPSPRPVPVRPNNIIVLRENIFQTIFCYTNPFVPDPRPLPVRAQPRYQVTRKGHRGSAGAFQRGASGTVARCDRAPGPYTGMAVAVSSSSSVPYCLLQPAARHRYEKQRHVPVHQNRTGVHSTRPYVPRDRKSPVDDARRRVHVARSVRVPSRQCPDLTDA